MDRIFCRKLMLGMMLLGIPTLFEVQAIDHALATFHLSSVDGPNYENIHQLIFCIWNAHTHCEPIALKRDEEGYGTCMIEGYQHCMDNQSIKMTQIIEQLDSVKSIAAKKQRNLPFVWDPVC